MVTMNNIDPTSAMMLSPASATSRYGGSVRMNPLGGGQFQDMGLNPATGQWENLYRATEDNATPGIRAGSDQFFQSQLSPDMTGFMLDTGSGMEPGNGGGIGGFLNDYGPMLAVAGVTGGALGGFDSLMTGGAGAFGGSSAAADAAAASFGGEGWAVPGGVQAADGAEVVNNVLTPGSVDSYPIPGADPNAAASTFGGDGWAGGDPGVDGSAVANDSAQYGMGSSGGVANPAGGVEVGGPGPSLVDMIKGLFTGGGGGFLDGVGSKLGLPSGGVGSLGSIFNIGSGIYGMMQADDLKKRAAQLAAQSNPFGQYRQQYGDQLSQLMADPSKITSYPGYKAGLQAVERRGAAQGWNGSGNMMASLADYGGKFFNDAVTQLGGLAGAGFNPAAGGQLALEGLMGGNSMAMQGLNRVGYGVTQKDPTSDLVLRMMLNKMVA